MAGVFFLEEGDKKRKKFVGNKTKGLGLGHQERNDRRKDEASLAQCPVSDNECPAYTQMAVTFLVLPLSSVRRSLILHGGTRNRGRRNAVPPTLINLVYLEFSRTF